MDLHFCELFLLVFVIGITPSKGTYNLRAGMPNVCPFQDVETRLVQVPCRQAFTRIAKVWKPDCGKSGHWCIGHERRTQYFTTYKQDYRRFVVTKYQCCHGWQQLHSQAGCMYRQCSQTACLNGGRVWMETPRDVSVHLGSRGRAVSMM